MGDVPDPIFSELMKHRAKGNVESFPGYKLSITG